VKRILKKIATRAVANDKIWSFLNGKIIPAVEYAKRKRRASEEKKIEDISEVLAAISPKRTVIHGPFAGMVYHEFKSFGSSLVSKVLGCYEKELHAVIEKIKSGRYTAIVDIGSAEGYYAVGFGMLFPEAKVYAFDTNPDALNSCKKMAQANGLGDRLEIGGFCSPETLLKLPLGSKALIISDCEGYEKSLFTNEAIVALAEHDLLVETHDYIDIEISQELANRFSRTHQIEWIQSLDDIQKAKTYDFSELSGYSLADRKMLLAEYRPAIMEWMYLSSKNQIINS
jgi:precorrin-6B methylase 2